MGDNKETDALRAFVTELFDDYWPEREPDLYDLQDLAVKHGILKHKEMKKPCGDTNYCNCLAENGPSYFPDYCYRKTSIIGHEEPFVAPQMSEDAYPDITDEQWKVIKGMTKDINPPTTKITADAVERVCGSLCSPDVCCPCREFRHEAATMLRDLWKQVLELEAWQREAKKTLLQAGTEAGDLISQLAAANERAEKAEWEGFKNGLTRAANLRLTIPLDERHDLPNGGDAETVGLNNLRQQIINIIAETDQ